MCEERRQRTDEKMFFGWKREKKETIITNKKFGERKRILWSMGMMVVISLQQQDVSDIFCIKLVVLTLSF